MPCSERSMDLFASDMLQLVEDAQGGIRYWPDFIDAALAAHWFDVLQQHADWTRLQRPMYDRIVDVPRLLASYRTTALPPLLPLADMLARVQLKVPAPYSGDRTQPVSRSQRQRGHAWRQAAHAGRRASDYIGVAGRRAAHADP